MKASTFIITLSSVILAAGAFVLLAKNMNEENLDHLYFDENSDNEIAQYKGTKAKEYNTDNLFI